MNNRSCLMLRMPRQQFDCWHRDREFAAKSSKSRLLQMRRLAEPSCQNWVRILDVECLDGVSKSFDRANVFEPSVKTGRKFNEIFYPRASSRQRVGISARVF